MNYLIHGLHSTPIRQWIALLTVFNISSEHPRFKEYRKVPSSRLNPRTTTTYSLILEEATHKLLQSLPSAPTTFITPRKRWRCDFENCVWLTTSSSSASTKASRSIKSWSDRVAGLLVRSHFVSPTTPICSGTLTAGISLLFIVRFVHEWFTGADFKES